MNKTELVKKIAEKAEVSQAQAKSVLEATLESVKEALQAGDAVQLIGFGTFSVAERAARTGKNPRTGEKITIPAKKVAKFKAGAGLI
jgi:DNA-binding protein HU-beta